MRIPTLNVPPPLARGALPCPCKSYFGQSFGTNLARVTVSIHSFSESGYVVRFCVPRSIEYFHEWAWNISRTGTTWILNYHVRKSVLIFPLEWRRYLECGTRTYKRYENLPCPDVFMSSRQPQPAPPNLFARWKLKCSMEIQEAIYRGLCGAKWKRYGSPSGLATSVDLPPGIIVEQALQYCHTRDASARSG